MNLTPPSNSGNLKDHIQRSNERFNHKLDDFSLINDLDFEGLDYEKNDSIEDQ
jgi:hypothetical protein